MNTTSSDNFYILLELFLDPPTKDWATIEARINEKKNEWNKKRNNPDGIVYQGLSERVENLRTSLRDEEFRKKEGAAARRAALRSLDEQIALCSGETIAPEQVAAIVKEYKVFFSETTIRKRVKVPVCDAAPTRRVPDPPTKPEDDSGLPRYDTSKLRELTNCLTALRKTNIYKALGVARTSKITTLLDAANEACRKARVAPTKTAEINALGTIGGLAKDFFKSGDSRKGFEASWANFQFEEKLKPIFNGRIVSKSENGRAVKFVTEENYARSLREATEEGMTPATAEWFVYDYYVNKRKCQDPRSCDVGRAFAESVNCPNCFRQNDKSASRCVECGYSLRTKCPKCGVESVLSDFCPSCGFSFGDMANCELAIQSAKEALGRRDFDEATRAWEKAKAYWPEHPELPKVATQLRDFFARQRYEKFEAELDSGRFDDALKLCRGFSFDGGSSPLVEKLKQRAEKRLQSEKDYFESLRKIEEFQLRKRFFSAERLIDELPSNLALRSEVVAKKAELEQSTRAIRNELAAATRESDLDVKKRKVEDLTSRYPDFEEAKNALASTMEALASAPPAPPSDVQTRSLTNGIEIKWSPSPSFGELGYRVERFPADCSESERARRGVVVCQSTGECSFIDARAEDFERYVYKVAATRKSGESSPEVQSEVAVRRGEARNVKVVASSNRLRVVWNVSPKVDGIVVYRKDLTRPNEARVLIKSVAIDGFVDAGLENGREYEYEVALRYRDGDGETQITYPQRFKGAPREVPPVVDLKADSTSKGLALTWTAPKRGEVRFWVLSEPSGFSCGETFCGSEQKLSERLQANPSLCRLGKTDERGRATGFISRKFKGISRCFILPATTDGTNFTFGEEREFCALPPASNIVAHYVDDGVYFSWDWPSDAVRAIILENSFEPPRKENYSRCKRHAVSKEDYWSANAWKRSISSSATCYFKLFMVYCVDGEERSSQGVNFRNCRTYVSYQKVGSRKSKGLLSRLWAKRTPPDETFLRFTTTDGSLYIPEICVVRQWNRPPLRRDDGDVIVESIGPSNDGKLELRLNEHFHADAYYRCYLKNRDDGANFALLDPPDAHLQLCDAEAR